MDTTTALSPETTAKLNQLWRHTLENAQPGTPANEVLDRLERKYQTGGHRCAPCSNRKISTTPARIR